MAGRGAGWHVAHFLRRSRKTPKPPKNSPWSLGKGTETTAGPVHPVLEDMGAGGCVLAASGVSRDLFTRTKNDPGAPSGKAAGEEGPALPVGPKQQVPSVSVSPAGMGHVLPAPAFSQKHSRSCPCSWSCWPLAWPVPYKGEGARAMLVTVPLSQERLSPPPWSPKLEQSKARALPRRRRVRIRTGGLPGTLGNLAPEASVVQGTQNKQKAHFRAWKASTAHSGMRDGGTLRVCGAECDSRAVQGHVLCHLSSCFPNSKGPWDEAAPPGDGNTVHRPMVPMAPLEGSPHCLWDSAQGWRGRAV